MLALLLGCGLRRGELLALEVNQIEQRDGRWVIPDLVGKGNRRRTVPVPAAVKIRVEEWVLAAELDLSNPVASSSAYLEGRQAEWRCHRGCRL